MRAASRLAPYAALILLMLSAHVMWPWTAIGTLSWMMFLAYLTHLAMTREEAGYVVLAMILLCISDRVSGLWVGLSALCILPWVTWVYWKREWYVAQPILQQWGIFVAGVGLCLAVRLGLYMWLNHGAWPVMSAVAKEWVLLVISFPCALAPWLYVHARRHAKRRRRIETLGRNPWATRQWP